MTVELLLHWGAKNTTNVPKDLKSIDAKANIETTTIIKRQKD